MEYDKNDTECSHCRGKISGNCCGDKIIYWCEDCGSRPEIIIDYPMMRFYNAVQATREEPGLSLEKMATVIKSRLDETEIDSLMKELRDSQESPLTN